MPIYSATINGKKRLVKAATIAGARNHLVKPLVPEITMLDAEAVADAMADGTKVEDASAPDAAPQADGAGEGEAKGDDA